MTCTFPNCLDDVAGCACHPPMPPDIRAIARDVIPHTSRQMASIAATLANEALQTAKGILRAD